MRKFIHRFLSEEYFVRGNFIYAITDKEQDIFDCPSITSDLLYNTLNKVFELTKKQLKWYVKSWVRKQSKSFDFNRFWTPPNPTFGVFFPAVKQIFARTIGMDLVYVQPMGAPRCNLIYLDHVAHDYEPRILARYADREIDPNLYGRIVIDAAERWDNINLLENQINQIIR